MPASTEADERRGGMSSLAETASVAVNGCLFKQPLTAQKLTTKDQPEVRSFLAQRPLQTFGLLGLVADNGLVSPHNRGDFYAYRGAENRLEGVALIGYNTIIDACSEAAIQVFAELAKTVVNPFLILGREQQIDRFIEHYADALYQCTAIDRYWLFRNSGTPDNRHPLPDLRRATLNDLEMVAQAHNQCGIEETGMDSLALDAEGFTARCARRIERGRTWVWIDRQRLKLKLDVITATREVAYLESLWVHPEERDKGYGIRLLNQMSERLLKTSASVCLLARENNRRAHLLYCKADYQLIDCYRAMFCDKTRRA
jgi:ribosomal protein S18 acetylase RimI-like enzyme